MVNATLDDIHNAGSLTARVRALAERKQDERPAGGFPRGRHDEEIVELGPAILTPCCGLASLPERYCGPTAARAAVSMERKRVWWMSLTFATQPLT
jgi:hypothetical protein